MTRARFHTPDTPDVTAARRQTLLDNDPGIERNRADARGRPRDDQGRFLPDDTLTLQIRPLASGGWEVTVPSGADRGWRATITDPRDLGHRVAPLLRSLAFRLGLVGRTS